MDDDDWFLVYAAGDNSYSLCPKRSVLNFKLVKVGDKVTFFYDKKSHIGKVTNMGDRGMLNKELNAVKAAVKRIVKPREPTVVCGKREFRRPQRFAFDDNVAGKSPAAKKKKDSVSEAKLKAGALEMNKTFLHSKTTETTVPLSSDEAPSDPEFGEDVQAKKKTLKSSLLKRIRNPISDSDDDQACCSSSLRSSEENSPSVQDLERILEDTKAKLVELKGKGSNSCHERIGTNDLVFDTDDQGGAFDSWKDHQVRPTSDQEEPVDSRNATMSPEKSTTPQIKDANSGDGSDNLGMAPKVKGDPRRSQMYGEDYEEDEMFDLGEGIFCKSSVLEEAQRKSLNAHHLVRRLLLGVFKEDAVLANTLTGQLPRAAGKDNYVIKTPMKGLYPKAIDAITDYALSVIRGNRWDPATRQALRETLTQKIGEVKRNNSKKLAKGGGGPSGP